MVSWFKICGGMMLWFIIVSPLIALVNTIVYPYCEKLDEICNRESG